MSIDIMISALEEYLLAKKDYVAGCGEEAALVSAKKRFAASLNDYIDWRTDGVLEERRKRISTERSINIADILTSNMKEVSDAITALNSAPTPPPSYSVDEWIKAGNHKLWFEAYRKWYEIERKNGIKIE